MTRSEIEKELSEKFKLQSSQSESILDTIIEHMTHVLKEEGRIEIRGFGSFYTKSYDAYDGRNPRTGEPVAVPSKKLPHFRPSKDLIKKVNDDMDL